MELYFKDDKQYKEWLGLLAEYCIQLDFKERFTILNQVGKGSYARVFLGKEFSMGEVFAIKSLNKEMIRGSRRGVRAIVDEVESMRFVKHPNICMLFGVFEDAASIHLIMEYCAGGEVLTRIVKRGSFS